MKKGHVALVKPLASHKFSIAALAVLIGLLVGMMVSRPGFSLPTIALATASVLLVGWLLRDAVIPMVLLEKLCFWLAFVTGFFGVALLPVDIGPFTLFPFRILLLALWALFIARAFVQGKLTVPVGAMKRYMLFLAFWIVYAVSSLAWAASKGDAIRHITFLSMGVSVIFFAVYYFRTREDLKRLYWIWLGVFVILVLLGFWEHLTGQHLPVSGYSEERLRLLAPRVAAEVRNIPTGVFDNPNDYAAFLALSLPFILGFIRYNSKQWFRLIAIGIVLASFYLIVVTGSRANLLAVLFEIAFLFLFLTKVSQKARLLLVSSLALGLAFVLLPSPSRTIVSKVVEQLGSIPAQIITGTGSAAIRLNLARNGLDFLYRTAGFGVGAGNAGYWMANLPRYDTAGVLNPHNWWLEILIDYGIFVFVGYVVVYIAIVLRLFRYWHRTVDLKERMIAESLLLAFIGFSVASISSSSIMAFKPNWMLFAFALAFLNYERGKQGYKTT